MAERRRELKDMNLIHTPYQYLSIQHEEPIALVCLNRPEKRNAISDGLIGELRHAFESIPASVRAIVLHAEGEHFCAGLDLNEMREIGPVDAMHHSRMWHAAFEQIQFGARRWWRC
jgi:enoyl-CoA hydratase/carnithine racemase